MKKVYLIFFSILGLAAYATYTSNHWLGGIVVPLLLGLFATIYNKEIVDATNESYIKMSEISPALYPPSLLTKTFYKNQRWGIAFVGVMIILSVIYNLIHGL
jgi:hypothetical protein